MIERSNIHIESRDSKIPTCVLAPFGIKEITQHLPIPEKSLQYELEDLRRTCAEGEAELLLQQMQLSRSYRLWGLYMDRVHTRTFIGTAGMSDPRPAYANTRSISCLIMPESARRQGYGRAAILGLSAVAMQKGGIGLHGGLSEHNKGSLGILQALGFTYLKTQRYYDFMGGEKTQFWTLLPPDERGQKAAARLNEGRTVDLAPGWKTYLEQRARARIKLSGKLLSIATT